MSYGNKLKHPSFDNYTEISSVLQMKRSNTVKIQVKLETPDRLKTVNDESNLKMNLASQGGVSDSRKESSIDQVSYWVMLKLLAM